MAFNVLTFHLDFEFVFGSGTWVDMKSFLDPKSNLQFARGVAQDRKMRASAMSFSFDNAGDQFTIGNPSSAYFNKLKQGIGVRFGWTPAFGVTKWEFNGALANVRTPNAGVPGLNRATFECVGRTSLYRLNTKYNMAQQTAVDVDDAMAAIMAGAGSSHYSFADSGIVLPYAFPRSDALTDLAAAAASDPGMLFFEDGQGRARLASMLGGYSSPAHTWGTTIVPEGLVEPDYRNASQFARASLNVASFQPSSEVTVLYRHPLNFDTGFCEPLPGYTSRIIFGEFDVMPLSVATKFSQSIVEFEDRADTLGVAMDASTTTLKTSSQYWAPDTFKAGDEIRVHQEIMLVTAVISSNNYMQVLTVTRAHRGTVAVAHGIDLPAGTRLYWRGTKVINTYVAALAANLYQYETVITVNNNPASVGPGVYLTIGGGGNGTPEVVAVTSTATAWGPYWRYTVTRAQMGTANLNHPSGRPVYHRTVQSPDGSLGVSYVRASEFANGLPAENPDITGVGAFVGAQDIYVEGRKFRAHIYNNDANTRYLADLVIGGTAFRPNEQTAKVTMEKAIPGVLGMPAGSDLAMPFGAPSLNVAKTALLAAVRSGRVPTPWLPNLTFTANQSENTTSMRSAEVADLVRYTGTGTAREAIDEWYRIMGVGGSLQINGGNADVLTLNFQLAPSHLWRSPVGGWLHLFNGVKPGNAAPVGGFGPFEVAPAGGDWSNLGTGNTWKSGFDVDALPFPMPVLVMGLTANPTPIVVNVGSANMTVGTDLGNVGGSGGSSPKYPTYPADSGGAGVTFRANSGSPTSWWECRVNPTTSKLILWNTTDGKVADVAWTPTANVEIEVRCQGDRIRVFLDCAAEPVLDITSTRFNTQTWMGPAAEITTVSGGITRFPFWRDITAHGL